MDHDPAYAITLCDAGGLIMVDWRRLARRLGVVFKLRDPPNIPPHGWSYFDHLVAVYVTLNTSDPRADAVIKKSHERADDLTWGRYFPIGKHYILLTACGGRGPQRMDT